MASPSVAPSPRSERRIPLAKIDAAFSALLGPTRGLGNSQPACFNRRVAMYLATRIGLWSTTAIGRFYNGRDHSTVCYGIQGIESLKHSDLEVEAWPADLKRRLDRRRCGNPPRFCDTRGSLSFYSQITPEPVRD